MFGKQSWSGEPGEYSLFNLGMLFYYDREMGTIELETKKTEIVFSQENFYAIYAWSKDCSSAIFLISGLWLQKANLFLKEPSTFVHFFAMHLCQDITSAKLSCLWVDDFPE